MTNTTVFPKMLMKQNDFNYIKTFKDLECKEFESILTCEKIVYDNRFNIVVSDKKEADCYLETNSNASNMFNFVNKRFRKMFALRDKLEIAKITRKYAKMYINNLYNKVKYNILDYTTGDIITDIIDSIINSVLSEHQNTVDSIYKISKKIEDEFLNTELDIHFVSKFDSKNFNGTIDSVKTIKHAFEYINKIHPIDESSNHGIVIKKFIKNLVKFNVLEFINGVVFRWCKLSKEFKYINTDSRLFFNRLSSSVIEQKDDFEEIMEYNKLKSKYGTHKNTMLRMLSNATLSSLNTIIDSFEYKSVIDTYDAYRNSIGSIFDSAFEGFKQVLDFFNNISSTVKFPIHNINLVNQTYSNAKVLFIDKIIELTKISCEHSKELGSNDSKDVIVFLKVIKKSFRFSSLCSVVKASKQQNFDKDKYKKGLFRDFMQSKTLNSQLKTKDSTEYEDFIITFIDKVWETIYSFVGFDRQERKPIIYTELLTTLDDMGKLSQYIETLSSKYRYTDSYEIIGSYIFNGLYVEEDNTNLPCSISPFVKVDGCYENFIN